MSRPGAATDPIDPPIRVERLGEVGSTMLVARRAAEDGRISPGSGVLFVARSQSAGRGRMGRSWASPEGGLWATLAWGVAGADAGDGLGLRVGVACLRTIMATLERHECAASAELKWPNDILIDGRKVCGCLSQIISHGSARFLLIGVGINANIEAHRLPAAEALRREATSLWMVIGREVDPPTLERDLCASLHRAVTATGVDAGDLALARARLHGVGKPIEGRLGDGSAARGVLLGLDDAGRPVVDAEGRTLTLADGDPT